MEPRATGSGEGNQSMVQQSVNPLNQGGGEDQDQILRLPRSYMPDIDTGEYIRSHFEGITRPSIGSFRLKSGRVIDQFCYSFDGQKTLERRLRPQDLANWDELDSEMMNDIEIYSPTVFLEILCGCAEFSKIISFLGLAPCLYWQIKLNGHFGLGRRLLFQNSDIKGKKRHEPEEESGSYHIWFILPASDIKLDHDQKKKRDPEEQKEWDKIHMTCYQFPFIQLSFTDRVRCFYMKVNLQSRSTRIFLDPDQYTTDKLCEVCEEGGQQEDYDPFIFLCSSISGLLHRWASQGLSYIGKIREIEAKVLALGESFDDPEQPGSKETRETERRNLQSARKLMLGLHELCTYQRRQKRNFRYLSNIINESVKEHEDMRETLGVSFTAYSKVHKNLCTLASWAEGIRQNLESAQKVTDGCLSTLSLLLSMRNNYSVEENTKFLAMMAEHSSKENYQVKDIAEANRKDSEAMKIIAIMTMFYLPGSFVATLFSMGIFNFDFEGGRDGNISLSRYWWVYGVVTIPLTISTFLFFRYMRGRQNNESKAIEGKNRYAQPGLESYSTGQNTT